MKTLLRDRNFKLLLAGQTLTMFGDIALFFVLAIWVKQLTGSNGEAGAVFLAFGLPSLASPLGGLLVDRFPRRVVLIANDIATGLMVLLFVSSPAGTMSARRGDILRFCWILARLASNGPRANYRPAPTMGRNLCRRAPSLAPA